MPAEAAGAERGAAAEPGAAAGGLPEHAGHHHGRAQPHARLSYSAPPLDSLLCASPQSPLPAGLAGLQDCVLCGHSTVARASLQACDGQCSPLPFRLLLRPICQLTTLTFHGLPDHPPRWTTYRRGEITHRNSISGWVRARAPVPVHKKHQVRHLAPRRKRCRRLWVRAMQPPSTSR